MRLASLALVVSMTGGCVTYSVVDLSAPAPSERTFETARVTMTSGSVATMHHVTVSRDSVVGSLRRDRMDRMAIPVSLVSLVESGTTDTGTTLIIGGFIAGGAIVIGRMLAELLYNAP
jgi:hypothetical protein